MNLAPYIDYTNLRADAARAEIEALCREAAEYRFAAVCVNGYYVPLARDLLAGTGVAVCAVAGFPLGMMPAECKAEEAKRAVRDGAKEIDMVINIGALKDGLDDTVLADIRAVTDAVHPEAAVKVILEACLLTDAEKLRACKLAVLGKADFVKTSTGFSVSGAAASDVRLMKQAVNGSAKVKAAGGIRTREDALVMIGAGADRIGTSRNLLRE